GTANHTVTVTVAEINEVAIVGGNVSLVIDSATAGSEPNPDTDTSTSLDWTTNATGQKITVATDQAAPNFTLTVEATDATGGTTAGPVALSTTAADFVTGISETTGSADLSYEASALASDGNGSDVHVVTYTIVADI